MNFKNLLVPPILLLLCVKASHAVPDTVEIDRLTDQADSLWRLKEDASELYFEAFDKSLSIRYSSGIMENAMKLGEDLEQAGMEDSARYYYAAGLEEAKEKALLANQALFHKKLGWLKKKRSDFNSALDHYLKVEEIGRQLQDSTLLAEGYQLKGMIFDDMGDYPTALKHYYDAQELFEAANDESGLAVSLINLSIIYSKQGHIEKAIRFNQRAIKMVEQLDDKYALAAAHVDLGILYKKQGKYEKALTCHRKGLEIFEEIAIPYGTLSCYHNIAQVYVEKNEHQIALDYFRKSLAICEKFGYRKQLALNLSEMAGSYLALNKLSQAREFALRSLEEAKAIDSYEELRNAYKILADIGEKTGDFESGWSAYKSYIQYRDSVLGKENEGELAAIQIHYDMEGKEKEIDLLKKENEIQQARAENERLVRYGLILGIVFAALFLGVLAVANWGKSQANKSLQAQRNEIKRQKQAIEEQKEELMAANESLKELNEEKDRLVGVVAHDLRSPLNQIKGLLGLMQLDSGNMNSDQLDYVDKAWASADRLTRMINQILDLKAINSKKINLKTETIDLRKLLEQSISYYHPEAHRKRIKLQLDLPADPCFVNVDPNYTIQIFENLISNALKFSPVGKSILVKTNCDQNAVMTEIIDEGPGISREDQKKLFGLFQRLTAQPTGGEKSTGLGLSIVKKYVEAMRGKVYCKSELGKGTKFVVEFKIEKAVSIQPQHV